MQGDGLLSLTGEPVNMVRPEGERAACGDGRLHMDPPDAGVGLHERAPHHADRSAGDVVVVPACVVAGRPADKPDVYVLVSVDRGVVPPSAGVGNLVAPYIRRAGQVPDKLSQFALVETPGG